MSGPVILFCLAAGVILFAVESSFQKITWRDTPSMWVPDITMLFGAAAIVCEILTGAFKPGWPVAIFAAAAAAIVFFCHRRIL